MSIPALATATLWIYLAPLLLALLVLVGLIVRTSRRKHMLLARQSAVAPPAASVLASVPARTRAELAPKREPEATPALRGEQVVEESPPNPDAQIIFAPAPARASPPPAAKNQSTLPRLTCSSCHRRYELGANYCYADGHPLISDTIEAAAEAPVTKVCRTCGTEANIATARNDGLTTHCAYCPPGTSELLVIEPSDTSCVAPTIPLLICNKCQQYAMPGTAYCPQDGEVLSPVLNARLTALPMTGFGPRRRLCRKCGTRYSEVCRYCAYDGTKLTPIN